MTERAGTGGVAAEIAFARLAAGRDVALVSALGVGAPLAFAAAASAARFAAAPAGGLMREPVAVHAPARPLGDLAEAEGRILLVDLRGGARSPLLAAVGDRPAIIRQRADEPAPHGYELVFAGADPAGDEPSPWAEAIWAAPGAISNAAPPSFQDLSVDLIDALAAYVGCGAFRSLRHVARGAEALLDPATLLDDPDQRQADFALGEGRALAGASDELALVVPRLSSDGGEIRLCLRCGEAPVVTDAPPDAGWSVRADGSCWRVDLSVRGAAEADRVTLFAPPQGDASAEVVECALFVDRPRMRDAIWDEACRRAADVAAGDWAFGAGPSAAVFDGGRGVEVAPVAATRLMSEQPPEAGETRRPAAEGEP